MHVAVNRRQTAIMRAFVPSTLGFLTGQTVQAAHKALESGAALSFYILTAMALLQIGVFVGWFKSQR